ncbi:group II intron maturase-specific domain-containing protein [Microbulbifer sp. SSSA002]|uniref:group II intron maturase-specific domain-containing protein n=1 Tax=unclassified Microbulbifer TaxID=2619833 RepID=UPI004039EE77
MGCALYTFFRLIQSLIRRNNLVFLSKRAKLVWHDKFLLKFKYRARNIVGRFRGVSRGNKLKELAEFLRGWINYFGVSQDYKNIDLDCWIRRRLKINY